MHYDPYPRPYRQAQPVRPTAAPGVAASGAASCEAAERMARAREAVAAGSATTGTVAERIRRAEEGMVQVADIAHEAEDRAERHALLELNDTLFALAQALRSSRVTEDYAAVGWG